VRGPDGRGLVFTINPMALPRHVRCGSQQGRDHTTTAALGVAMLTRWTAACHREGLARTKLPLPMDSWLVSQPLRPRLHDGGFTKISMAGQSPYPLPIDGTTQDAAPWQQDRVRRHPTWGIAGPACRVQGRSPTCGATTRFLFQKSPPRRYDVMHFRRVSMRGADIWHMWTQQHLVECFWQMRKSIWPRRAMPWHGHGLDTAWLIKVFASWLARRLQAQRPFATLSITQIRRTRSRDHDLQDMLTTHFPLPILAMERW
jgi:hypothetical protein